MRYGIFDRLPNNVEYINGWLQTRISDNQMMYLHPDANHLDIWQLKPLKLIGEFWFTVRDNVYPDQYDHESIQFQYGDGASHASRHILAFNRLLQAYKIVTQTSMPLPCQLESETVDEDPLTPRSPRAFAAT